MDTSQKLSNKVVPLNVSSPPHHKSVQNSQSE